jgi:hypothetical protein
VREKKQFDIFVDRIVKIVDEKLGKENSKIERENSELWLKSMCILLQAIYPFFPSQYNFHFLSRVFSYRNS